MLIRLRIHIKGLVIDCTPQKISVAGVTPEVVGSVRARQGDLNAKRLLSSLCGKAMPKFRGAYRIHQPVAEPRIYQGRRGQ